jgi:hypothetical protein
MLSVPEHAKSSLRYVAATLESMKLSGKCMQMTRMLVKQLFIPLCIILHLGIASYGVAIAQICSRSTCPALSVPRAQCSGMPWSKSNEKCMQMHESG